MILDSLDVCKPLILQGLQKKSKKISTHLLARLGWFCPVVSEPVKPYFTRFLRVLTFCLDASNGVVFCENGVVNGVVEWSNIFLIIQRMYQGILMYYNRMDNEIKKLIRKQW